MENLATLEPKQENSQEKDPLVERYLGFFRRLRDDWSNDIPDDIIHSIDENNKFKVRVAWFTVLVNELKNFKGDYLQGNEDNNATLLSDVESFIAEYTGKDFINLERVRPEDVEAGDSILDRVINYLEDL